MNSKYSHRPKYFDQLRELQAQLDKIGMRFRTPAEQPGDLDRACAIVHLLNKFSPSDKPAETTARAPVAPTRITHS